MFLLADVVEVHQIGVVLRHERMEGGWNSLRAVKDLWP